MYDACTLEKEQDSPTIKEPQQKTAADTERAERIAKITTDILLKQYKIRPEGIAQALLEKEKDFCDACQHE